MQFSRSLVALVASAAYVAAAPSVHKRQSQCVSSYSCPFDLNVAGCSSSQISDGQVRVAPSSISEISDGQARCDLNGTTPTQFTLSSGQITDSAGRVCEISSQDQFQCSATPDAGATTTGFSVCNGLLTFNSNSSFVACLATGDIPGYNIYTASVDRSTVTGCMPIEIDVPACAASSSSCPAPSTTTQTVTSTEVPAAVTVTETAAPVTLPASTVNVTLPAQTVTLPASTIEETQPAQTVTLPASTVQVTQPAQTIVQTITQVQTVVQTQVDVQTAVVTATDVETQVQVSVETDIATQVQTDIEVETQVNVVTATPAATTLVASVTPTTAAQATCTNITRALGSSNFPNTIEVVNSGSSVSGSSYFAYIGAGNSTIFTFNSVASSGQCSLNFYFPTTAEIQAAAGTTSYEISASSIDVTVYQLTSVASVDSTYASKPARGASYSATLTPGQNTTISTFDCASGQTSYEFTTSSSATLSFFEDYNLPVLGAAIASCA